MIPEAVFHAIQVAKELEAKGGRFLGIRLDSEIWHIYLRWLGRCWMMQVWNAIIVASGDLDEGVMRDLRMQGAKIDSWGVGTKLITGDNNPALGGVYKLVALEGKRSAGSERLKSVKMLRRPPIRE